MAPRLLRSRSRQLVAIVIRLIWPVLWDAEIFRLGRGQCRELDIQAGEVCASHFLVKLFRKHVHTKRELLRSRPEGNLSQNLIGEGARHNERRMASSASTFSLSSTKGHFQRIRTRG